MSLFEDLLNKKEKLSVIGLGYVGLPLAVAFSKKLEVIGFDINEKKINTYKKGGDVTKEVGNKMLKESNICFSTDEKRLIESKFHIVAVPTPIKKDKTPDLTPVIGASKILGRNLTRGSIVVYESTVYPGVTEDICVKILEKESGLCSGKDFKIGYSPERINPGDKIHRLENIIKVVSGCDEETLDIITKVYELIIKAGVYRAENIKIAEAAKVIENSQRDINIAFMNELSIVFNKMGIDTKSVLKAADTKWNFLKFTPGLVGGHCIGVDPYYLTYKAEQMGYHSQIILSGRRINDNMGKYVAENTVKMLIKADKQIKGSTVVVMGITFKENCSDVRNTKVVDIINELKEYGIEVKVVDSTANSSEVWKDYHIKLYKIEEIKNVDAVIVAVPHDEFKKVNLKKIREMFFNYSTLNNVNEEAAVTIEQKNILIDVKGIFNRKEAESMNYLYWRL